MSQTLSPDRTKLETAAMQAITTARTTLVLSTQNAAKAAFFSTLALRMKPTVNWSIPTMATDGRDLYFNPEFTLSLKPAEVIGTVLHEVMHVVMQHLSRRGSRDKKIFNQAADLAANSIVDEAGFVLPKFALMPGRDEFKDFPKGLSTEEYYDRLFKEQEQSGGGSQSQPQSGGQQSGQSSGNQPGQSPGQSSGQQPEGDQESDGQGQDEHDPSDIGQFIEAKDPAEASELEAEWQVAVAQAAQIAKGRGDLPAGLQRLVGQVTHPTLDWRALLRQFVSTVARNDYTWQRLNKRMLAHGYAFPGLRSEELGTIVVAIDTSGSIGQKELDLFAGEFEAALGAYQCSAKILYHDTVVAHVDEWQTSDGPIKLNPHGGGGTSHHCVFNWIEEQGITPACVIALTDLDTRFPDIVPDYPVLWAVTGNPNPQAPFGEMVVM